MPLTHLRIPHITPYRNEFQAKMLVAMHLTNILLVYLAALFTIKLGLFDK